MARDRARGRNAGRRREAEVAAAALRREARGWFIRAVLALALAVLVGLLSLVFATLPVVAAVVCLVQAVRRAVAAQQLVEGG